MAARFFCEPRRSGGEGFAYIPDWLGDRLGAAKRHGARPFIESAKPIVWKDVASKNPQGPRADREVRGLRLRRIASGTFARILLQRARPVADVADLLGDDEDTAGEGPGPLGPDKLDKEAVR